MTKTHITYIKKLPSLLILLMLSLIGCNPKDTRPNKDFTTITPKEAKEIIDKDQDAIILDVRTEREYANIHIEDAILLPNTEINENAREVLPDKSATILVYCRSGNRSASAASDLADLGYTNVYNFGGIIDWPYETVSSN